jgi:feruloyl esterase
MVVNDTMAQCDALDGVKDGIIEDPTKCNYDPKGLACTTDKTANCLTPAQLETVRKIYSPLLGPDGTLIYPRLQPGTSASALASGQPFQFTSDWFRYGIYNDPTWDARKLSYADLQYAMKLDPQGAESFDGDLGAFKNRGAKVIHYHGHEDQLISSGNSARYYELVQETMKMKPEQLDSFYRYFEISGMSHCRGGPGANMIGQGLSASHTLDPDSNVLTAIVRWVEDGVPPDTIRGAKFKDDSKTKEVQFQRKHCRYPKKNKYDGKGDPRKAESWGCVTE